VSKRFIFGVQTDHVLTIDEIWPDGDAPDDPTPEDARKAFLEQYRYSICRGLEDWGIAPEADDLFVTELAKGITFNGK